MREDAFLRSELVFGAVFGLGVSALGWTLAFSPPPLDPAALALIALTAASAALRGRLSLQDRHGLLLPLALASLTLYGLGAAVSGAGLAALATPGWQSLGTGQARREPAWREMAFEMGLLSLAVSAAGVAALAVGTLPGLAPGLAWVLSSAVFGGVFLGARSAVVRIAGPLAPRPAGVTVSTPRWSTVACCGGIAVAAGMALSVVYARDALRIWMLAGPAIYFVYLLGRARAERQEARRRRDEQSDRIYRSITRALTRAVASDDPESSRHLWRVQTLGLAIGERLGLERHDLDALSSAALLHDIGKVAVPEPILNKPGRLTRREMECVKVHPAFGAEVLEALSFPPSIRSIVRHHHERWDGRGYPDGLAEDDIPIGARILSVVDCFDSMTSDRPYRSPLPDAEATRHLRHESGAMFDPMVVDAILEQLEEETASGSASPDHGEPATAARRGRPHSAPKLSPRSCLDALDAIARASTYTIGFDECCTLIRSHLLKILPHRSMLAYSVEARGTSLRARYAAGEARDRLLGRRLPTINRISGTAVTERRIVVGHDHSAPLERSPLRSDFEDLLDDPLFRRLGSSLSAPMVVDGECVGALSLYDDDDRRFSAEDQRNLATVAGYLARALRRERAGGDVAGAQRTDALTGLPDALQFRREAHRRFADPDRHPSRRDALIGFRIPGLADVVTREGIDAAEAEVCEIAQRLSAACESSESIARLGHDLFVALCPVDTAGGWIGRWHALLAAADQASTVEGRGLEVTVAEVRFPDDGGDVDSLLATLDARLIASGSERRSVIPFRNSRTA